MKKTIAVLAIISSGLVSVASAQPITPAVAAPVVSNTVPAVLGGTALSGGAVAGTLLALVTVVAVVASGSSSGTTTSN